MTSTRKQEPASGPPLVIEDRPDERRYVAHLGDDLAGWVDYGRVGTRIVALHTEVPPEFGGRGIATKLVRRVLDDARAAGATVTPRCPLFAAHFQRHPEDADILAVRPPRDPQRDRPPDQRDPQPDRGDPRPDRDPQRD